MILFHSEYCAHCRMLIETIKRHDTNGLIKQVSIENLKILGKKPPPQIHAVPALMVLPEKKLLFGKQVFDYLLLPTQGILMKKKEDPTIIQNTNDITNLAEPIAFSIRSGFSDPFSTVTDKSETDYSILSDRLYGWTNIDNDEKIVDNTLPFQEETRTKKTIDMDAYRIQRDLDLKQDEVNTNQLPLAQNTR